MSKTISIILFSISAFFSITHADAKQTEKNIKKTHLLGQVHEGRYYEPANLFSIEVPSFYEEKNTEDHHSEGVSTVIFFSDFSSLLRLEVLYISDEKKQLSSNEAKIPFFKNFYQDEIVGNIKRAFPKTHTLFEKELLESGRYFAVVEIPGAPSIKNLLSDEYEAPVRGYLISLVGNQFVIISAQDCFPNINSPEGRQAQYNRLLEKLSKSLASYKNLRQLNGQVIEGKYHSSKNVFSCDTSVFGKKYTASQDRLDEDCAAAAFYDEGNFNKIEIIKSPGIEKRDTSKEILKGAFDCFVIGILNEVDHAEGINILSEEVLEIEGCQVLFVAISVKKTDFSKKDGQNFELTRGHLIYVEKDKVVVLSNQIASLQPSKEDHKNKIALLKEEILRFMKSVSFNVVQTK